MPKLLFIELYFMKFPIDPFFGFSNDNLCPLLTLKTFLTNDKIKIQKPLEN
jgi:hypothetical protein